MLACVHCLLSFEASLFKHFQVDASYLRAILYMIPMLDSEYAVHVDASRSMLALC
jgi:hypothetical protein